MARLLALFSICFAVAGCELVADFDRAEIPTPDAGKATKPDGAVPPNGAGGTAPVPPVDGGLPGDGGRPDGGLPDAAFGDEDAGDLVPIDAGL